MTIPMIVLALGSVGAGYLLVTNDALFGWLEPSVGELQVSAAGLVAHSTVSILTVLVAALGVLLAYLLVARRPVPVERPQQVSFLVRAARADLFANSINEALVARPGTWLARALVYLDNKGVDGLVNGIAALLGGASGRLRRVQTGFVRSYALTMLGGSILVVAALLAVRFI